MKQFLLYGGFILGIISLTGFTKEFFDKFNIKLCNGGIIEKSGCNCKGLFLGGKNCNLNPHPCVANVTYKCVHITTVKPEDVINQTNIYINLKNNEFDVFKNNDLFLGFGNASDTFVVFKYGQYVRTTRLIGLYDSQLNYDGLSVPLVRSTDCNPSTAGASNINVFTRSPEVKPTTSTENHQQDLKYHTQPSNNDQVSLEKITLSFSIISAVILMLYSIKYFGIKIYEKCKPYFITINTTTPPNMESNSLTHEQHCVFNDVNPSK